MIKSRTLKPIKSGFEDDKVAFFPRMASQAEREEVETHIAEAEADSVGKHQRLYEIKRDAIADWSVSMPQRMEKVKGETKLVPLVDGAANTSEAMTKFFGDRTPEHEEVISKTYNAFLNLMGAEVSFL